MCQCHCSTQRIIILITNIFPHIGYSYSLLCRWHCIYRCTCLERPPTFKSISVRTTTSEIIICCFTTVSLDVRIMWIFPDHVFSVQNNMILFHSRGIIHKKNWWHFSDLKMFNFKLIKTTISQISICCMTTSSSWTHEMVHTTTFLFCTVQLIWVLSVTPKISSLFLTVFFEEFC